MTIIFHFSQICSCTAAGCTSSGTCGFSIYSEAGSKSIWGTEDFWYSLLAGIIASAAYFAIAFHSTIPELGASGAIAGVMGAYMVMFPKAKILTVILILFLPFFVQLSVFVYLGYWFLLQLLSGTVSFASRSSQGGVAWWAHVGGFGAGILLLPFFRRKERPSS